MKKLSFTASTAQIIKLTLMALILVSCLSDKDKELIGDCDGLAMKYYRGLPKEAKLYKDHCTDKTLKYTPELCKQAMGDLMIKGSPARLKTLFGDRILECFNKADFDRFSKE